MTYNKISYQEQAPINYRFFNTFLAIADILEAKVCQEDGCYLAVTEVDKCKLIIQYEPFLEEFSFLGELDNPNSSNTYKLNDKYQEVKILVKGIVTLQRLAKELGGKGNGWKTLLQKNRS